MGPNRDGLASLDEVERVYRSRLPELRRVAAAVSGNREAAPDIVQQAFAQVVRELSTFRRGGSIDRWIWRIVVNTARNHRRDSRVLLELPDELPASMNGHSEVGRVSTAIAGLSERQRLVVFLRYYADLDYGSIADALEITPGTVGATLTAARAALQEALLQTEAKR